jgi:(p)ppGpp synthase/HD superfamily hydrolase
MNLTERQKNYFEFIKEQHGEQKRKYTGEPYWYHLHNVAKLVLQYMENVPWAVEIALGHDLFEDTKCSADNLYDYLITNGYDQVDTLFIISGIESLTDFHTAERFPKINREQRKQKEAERLGSCMPIIQSIKYADLIDNCSSIIRYDPGFAKVYLKEKRNLLQCMRLGNIDLLIECCWVLASSERILKIENMANLTEN